MSETCQALWNNLKTKVFPENTENIWIERKNEFKEMWNFPNCIGAIDGKHVILQIYKIPYKTILIYIIN